VGQLAGPRVKCGAGQPAMYGPYVGRGQTVSLAYIAIPNLGYTSQSNPANLMCSVSQLLQHPFLLQFEWNVKSIIVI